MVFYVFFFFSSVFLFFFFCYCFFFQAEDGIRDLVRSRGLGDVYKRQELKTQLKCQDLDFNTSLILCETFLAHSLLMYNNLSLIHI